ncbi:hypothetical protein MNBD_GAMMA16-1618 [hydrothermal vent metagenome]|uniref:Lipoprotein n=1 Tax=hydrothermal vent metagenome TaxID=652676 RepID=A0A3B0ZV82_9ZZZZ
MRLNKGFTAPLLAVFLITGCATNQEMYYWGEYEQLIHNAYIEPGSADPQTQIEKLEADIQKTEALGKKSPPGIYAHLGFLYAVQGKNSQSKAAFMEERSLYPESRTFIDGMLARAKQNEENR